MNDKMSIYSKQLLIFDWDGTLMDSQARIVNCLRTTIEDLNKETRNDEQLSNVIGLGFSEALFMLYPEEDDSFHHDFIECYRE